MPLLEEGKFYNFNGRKVKLYPIAKLCSALKEAGYYRDSQTIRKWELHGVTPLAVFRSGNKRLYTKRQIEIFCETAIECDIKQGYSLAMSDFSQKMWERLKALNLAYKEGRFENE